MRKVFKVHGKWADENIAIRAINKRSYWYENEIDWANFFNQLKNTGDLVRDL